MNGQLVDPASALPPDSDVVQFARVPTAADVTLPLQAPLRQAPPVGWEASTSSSGLQPSTPMLASQVGSGQPPDAMALAHLGNREEVHVLQAAQGAGPKRYTGFDVPHGARTWPSQPDWYPAQFVWDAIKRSKLPGQPTGRLLRYHVAGFPLPQVVVSRDTRPYPYSVVFDLRAIGFDVHSVDAAPGTTFGQALSQIGTQLLPSQLWTSCQDGSLEVLSNGAPATLSHLTLPPVDVVEIKPSWIDTRARYASRPLSALPSSAETGRADLAEARQRADDVDPFLEGDGAYSSIDRLLGLRFRAKFILWTDDHCRRDAVTSADYLIAPSGRVLRFPLEGLAVPQVLLRDAGLRAADHAFVLDLRAFGKQPFVVGAPPGTTVEGFLQAYALLPGAALSVDEATSCVNFQVNGAVSTPTAIISAQVDTLRPFPCTDGILLATLLPVARRRPPTPPLPARNRWGRLRYQPPDDVMSTIDVEGFGSEATQCTIFDPVRQVEVVTSFSCASADSLLRFATQRARHLGNVVEGRILTSTVDGYPTPQVCIHSPINSRYVMLPVVLPTGVCTLPVLRSASPFELALEMEGTCAMPRLHRHLIARQLSVLQVNHQPADPFLPDAFVQADSARLVPAFPLSAHRAPPSLHPVASGSEEMSLPCMVHREGHTPLTVTLPRLYTPFRFLRFLSSVGAIPPDHVVRPSWMAPVVQDVGVHFLVTLPPANTGDAPASLVDLRRIVTPPSVLFWVATPPDDLSLASLQEWIHAEFPSAGPILEAYVDDEAADHAQPLLSTSLITFVGLPRSSRHRIRIAQPAIRRSRDMLNHHPGFRSVWMRFPGYVRGSTSTSTTTTSTWTRTFGGEVVPELPAPAYIRSVPHTVTADCPDSATHPCSPLEHDPIVFHLASSDGAVASSSFVTTGCLAEVMTGLCDCLHRQGCMPEQCDLSTSPFLAFLPGGAHVFCHASTDGSAARCWLYAPEWVQHPISVNCAAGISRVGVFQSVGIQPRDDILVSLGGVVWPRSIFPHHGEVVLLCTASRPVHIAPLHTILHRVPDVQTLLFRIRGPSLSRLADRPSQHALWCQIVGHCQNLLGLNRPGQRATLACHSMSSIVVCPGTFLLPTLQQTQRFYNERLASHLGARTFKDTDRLDRDHALLLESCADHFRRPWIIQLPTGCHVLLADPVGSQLQNFHLGSGWYIQPTTLVGEAGIACITRRVNLGPLERDRSHFPAGLSSSDSSPSFDVAEAGWDPAESTRFLQYWAAELRHVRDFGPAPLVAPGTPDEAFEGRPPPPRDPDAAPVLIHRDLDFHTHFAPFLPILDMVPSPDGAEPSSSSSSTSGSDSHVLLQTKLHVFRAASATSTTTTCASGQVASVAAHSPPASPPTALRISLAAALTESSGAAPRLSAVHQALHVVSRLTAGTPFLPAYPSIAGLEVPRATRAALASTLPPWPSLSDLPQGSSAWFYSDGSTAPAGGGWAVAICFHVPGYGWTFQGLLAASSRASYFREVAHDSCEAEAAALCAALSWAVSLPKHVPLHFCFDCMGAAKAANGEWAIPVDSCGSQRPAHCIARCLHLLLTSLDRAVSYLHIRSHQGEAWNELVDCAAKAAASSGSTLCLGWEPWLQLLASDLLPWLWFLPAGRDSFALPLLEDLVCRTASQAVGLDLVPEPSRPSRPSSEACSSCTISCATFNVCTLRPAESRHGTPGLYRMGIQQVLQAQCRDLGLGIVGLQETRLPSASAFTTSDFLCFHSSATPAGMEGCALWIAKDLLAIGGSAVGSESLCLKHCTILVSEPRLLCVRVQTSGFQAVCLVAHAPHSRSPEEVRHQWWRRFEEVLSATLREGDSSFICIDANARVGIPCSPRVGSVGAEQRTPNGEALETALEQFDLFLRSTTDAHQGPSYTWTSPAGSHSRLDYVVLSSSLRPLVCAAWTVELDACLRHLDHKAAVVQLRVPITACIRSPSDLQVNIAPASETSWCQALSCVPPQPWALSVDLHDARLACDFRGTAKRFRQPAGPRPTRSYVTAQTVQFLALWKHVRALLRDGSRQRDRAILRILFASWRVRTSSGLPLEACLQVHCVSQVPVIRHFDVAIALHWRAFLSLAQCIRSQVRASKRAYLEELGELFAAATTSGDTHRLHVALRSLVPSTAKKKRLGNGAAVLRPDGLPFASPQERAVGWSHYFASIEGGELQDWPALRARQADLLASSKMTPDPDLEHLPTVLAWEKSFRCLQKGKAAGPDGLTTTATKAALVPTMALSPPLALKTAACRTEPLLWRGGETFPLFKQKGSGSLFTSYRSILLSSLLAKRFHSWIRTSLVPHFIHLAEPLQCGVAGGLNTAHLSLLVRTFQGHMRSRNLSHGLLFLDFQQAFYSVIGFLAWSSSVGIHDSHARAILASLETGEDSASAMLAPHLQSQLNDVLSNTWFQVRDCPHPVATARGSRPGDPLADILFGLVLAPPLRRLNCVMQDEGLTPTLSTGGLLPREGFAPSSAAWHDDVVVFVAAEHSDRLRAALSRAASVCHDVFGASGLMVNYLPGKTEALACPLGLGRKQLLRDILSVEDPTLACTSSWDAVHQVRLVSEYRHLGSIIQDDSGLKQDISLRLRAAKSALAPLAKPVFGRLDVTPRAKTALFISLMLSRLAHNAGAWGSLLEYEKSQWSAGVFGLYRSLVPRCLRQQAAHLTAAQLCAHALAPAPLAFVSILRLRLAGQVATRQCAGVHALLDASVGDHRCWIQTVLSDLAWARTRLAPSDLEGLDADPEPCHFMQWLAAKGNAWRHVLRRLWHLSAGDGAAQDLPTGTVPAVSRETCRLCGFACSTKHSLASHLAIKHHLKQKIHFLVRSTVCPACSMDFHTRTRLLKHLSRSSPACRVFVQTHSRHCSIAEQDQLADAEKRRLRASKGRGRLDRLPAKAGVVEPVPLADSSDEELLFYLDDFL